MASKSKIKIIMKQHVTPIGKQNQTIIQGGPESL